METVAERNVASAEAYYSAMNNKAAARIASYLHSDIQFIGPMATLAGRVRFSKRLNDSCPYQGNQDS